MTGVDWTTTSSEQEKMRCELHALQIHAHVTKEVDPLLKRCVCKYQVSLSVSIKYQVSLSVSIKYQVSTYYCKYQVSTYHYQQCLNGPCVIVLMCVVWLVHLEFNKL